MTGGFLRVVEIAKFSLMSIFDLGLRKLGLIIRGFLLFAICVFGASPVNGAESTGDVSTQQKLIQTPRPFSADSNYMSLLGSQRWRFFQESGKWPQAIITEQVGDDVTTGGFSWYGFLSALQRQTKEYPYAKKFINSWHIETNGPDWHDDYMLYMTYDRGQGIVYDPFGYKAPRPSFRLSDALIPKLLGKFREIYEGDKHQKIGNGFDAAEKEMLKWWKDQTN